LLDFRSPITWAEARFQRRTIKKSGRWMPSLLMGVFVGVLLLNLLRPIIGANPSWFTLPIDDIISIWDTMIEFANIALVFVVAAHYFLALSQGVQGGTQSVVREKTAKTWENLLLTGIDAHTLITGKWTGTVQTVWRAHRRLLIPRALALAWLVVTTAISDPIADNLWTLIISLVLLTALGTIVFPAVNIGLSTALGMIGSLIGSSDSSSRVVSSVLQVIMVILVAGMAFALLPLDGSTNWLLILLPVLFSSFDGGLTMVLTLPNSITFGEQLPLYLLAIAIQVLAIRGLTVLTLRAARRLALWQNVSEKK